MKKFILTSLLSIVIAGNAGAIPISNGSLTVDILGNGAIGSVTFGGSNFYDQGVHVSDYGFQIGTNVGSFSRLDTNGGLSGAVSVSSVTGGGTSAVVEGRYSGGGSNIDYTRTYSLVDGEDVLQTTTQVTNNGSSAVVLRLYDTFDPDQGRDQGLGFSTFNDVFTLSTPSGDALVGQATAPDNGLTVVMGSLGAATVASGNPFRISSGSGLNTFFSSPFDGQGNNADSGTHVGFELMLAAGATLDATYDQAYGLTPGLAQTAFINANPEPVSEPVPEPATLTLMGTGLVGLIGYGRRKRQQQDV